MTTRPKSFLVILSEKGGGDRPPVIALACGLRDRGHEVAFLCDEATARMVASTRLPAHTFPPALDRRGQIRSWFKSLQGVGDEAGSSGTNPMIKWAEPLFPFGAETLSRVQPDLIISSLFGLGLADELSGRSSTPWCFVNPSFYFGDLAATSWEQDWHGPLIPQLARDCFHPLVKRADIVLHATDPEFDYAPTRLPENHHYVGFLQWEPATELPDYLVKPGDPWVLITLSSVRQEDEITLVRASLSALADRRVRVLLTQPDTDLTGRLGSIESNVTVDGFVPHSPVLERCTTVISHAGHGIVSKALERGVPMVLLPWDRDQPGVAARAEKLGVAYVVPREAVTTAEVGKGIDAILDDPAYRQAARVHADRLAQVDSVAFATRLLEQM